MKIKKLVLASHNQGKITELSMMLAPFGVEVVSAGDLNLPDVDETANTFEGNARLKAETLAKLSGMPCLADDSGLCVEALDGAPGVYTARYAPNRDFDKGMDKLLAELDEALKKKSSQDRRAHFACCLALALPENPQNSLIFEGIVEGKIGFEKCGSKGFGFDAIFIPDEGDGRSFAQMSADEKEKISHRGRAIQKFVKEIFAN